MIALIENGMELSKIREILNEVIQQINQGQTAQISYNDLANRPCINGVELNEETKAGELNLTLSQLANKMEIESLVTQIGEQKAAAVADNALASKLDCDFGKLPELRYNFKDDMLLTVSDGSSIFKATVNDLIIYLKYLILRDATFEKLATGKGHSESGENGDSEHGCDDPGGETIDDPKPIKP